MEIAGGKWTRAIPSEARDRSLPERELSTGTVAIPRLSARNDYQTQDDNGAAGAAPNVVRLSAAAP